MAKVFLKLTTSAVTDICIFSWWLWLKVVPHLKQKMTLTMRSVQDSRSNGNSEMLEFFRKEESPNYRRKTLGNNKPTTNRHTTAGRTIRNKELHCKEASSLVGDYLSYGRKVDWCLNYIIIVRNLLGRHCLLERPTLRSYNDRLQHK